jgi:hypothetical protein
VDPLLLLPTTKRQEGEVLLQCLVDQRWVGVLEKAGWWFGRISNEFEIINNRHGGEYMHDAFFLNFWV